MAKENKQEGHIVNGTIIRLVDKDMGRLKNLSAEETNRFFDLLFSHFDTIMCLAENDLSSNHKQQSELMEFFELYHKSKQIRLVPEP